MSEAVLIESDWNLKTGADRWNTWLSGINRIRLEFKVLTFLLDVYFLCCINRIRLEFKATRNIRNQDPELGINRIRLEFKVCPN